QGGNAVEGDLHAMRPTDESINGARGNKKYGEVTGGTPANAKDTNGNLLGGYSDNNTFEPLDFAKGDCARTILYDYVVANSMSSVTQVFVNEATLLQWCAMDPVDTYEMSRNDVAQEIQGCRNPFVDYPELAWLLLGKQIPEGLTTPSNGNQQETYKITASSNNTAYGTVKLQGKTIVATPAEGCYAGDYTVVSGSATVTRDGNNFIVAPKSDCSVRINFYQKKTVTVTFRDEAPEIKAYAGEEITLPDAQDYPPYTFVGWVEEEVEKTSVKPNYRKSGSTYIPTADKEFIPLYSWVEDGDGPGTGKWTLMEDTAELKAGLQVVIAHYQKGKVAGDIATTYMAPVDATFSSDYRYIESLPESAVILTLGGEEDFWTLSDSQGRQLGCSKLKNIGWGIGTLTWKIAIFPDGADVASTISTYGTIRYNVSDPRFTTYSGNPATHLPRTQLYMMDGTAGTTYYTTYLPSMDSCTHEDCEPVEAVEPTCTEDGNIAYYICMECRKLFKDSAATEQLEQKDIVVKAVGHSYEAVITEPTCTEPGCTTYTCSRCADAYEEDAVAALGHEWDEGVVTVEPTQTETGVKTYTCLRCEETKTETIPALGEEDPGTDPEDPTCEYGEDCGSLLFTDMPELSNWAHAGIDFALKEGLFNGMGQGLFAPNKTMTRAMLVTVLWRSAGEPEAEAADFTDVEEGQWYSMAVAWAAQEGVVNGMGDGTFRPNSQITREQLATILFRYVQMTEMDPPERASLDAFPDAEKIQSYAVEALQWAVAKGLVNGIYDSHLEQTFLRPEGSATRAQVATILMRFLQEPSAN
ncbi:MAG: S-layer homology domain-containing protein, partial [Oscillospiraceae bacterium]|nr:S-layer homology domain-containing protein [Oscillospiraceae bacterium]